VLNTTCKSVSGEFFVKIHTQVPTSYLWTPTSTSNCFGHYPVCQPLIFLTRETARTEENTEQLCFTTGVHNFLVLHLILILLFSNVYYSNVVSISYMLA